MEKRELITIIGNKYNEISKLEDEIKILLIEYGTKNTQFKTGDKITSDTFNNNNIILECTGDFQYSLNYDSIYVDCKIITTNVDKYKVGTVFSISEKYLKNL